MSDNDICIIWDLVPFLQQWSSSWQSRKNWNLNFEISHCLSYGWPKSNFFISISHSSETMYIWPHVVKTKMGLKSGGFFWEIVNKQLKIVNKQLKTEKNPPLLKPILVFITYGLGCIVIEVQPFEVATFDLGHPVIRIFRWVVHVIFWGWHQNRSGIL